MGQAGEEVSAFGGAGQVGEELQEVLEGPHAIRDPAQVLALQGPVHHEGGPVRDGAEQLPEGLATELEAPGVRVLALGQLQQAHLEAQGQGQPEALFHGPATGGIAIEAEHHPAGEAAQSPQVLLREGRAQGRHGLGDAGLVQL